MIVVQYVELIQDPFCTIRFSFQILLKKQVLQVKRRERH